jgi:hypothetical protein
MRTSKGGRHKNSVKVFHIASGEAEGKAWLKRRARRPEVQGVGILADTSFECTIWLLLGLTGVRAWAAPDGMLKSLP